MIDYKGHQYPRLQQQGFASQYAFPFAKQICKGVGLDIGYAKEEWKFEGARGIDNSIDSNWDAEWLPNNEEDSNGQYDYIFSSHCLEHTCNWVTVLDYWRTKLKDGGVLFLYLPHPNQEYWKPWNNTKHVHILDPYVIEEYLNDREWKNIFVTKGYDLNHSFYVIANK